MQNWALVIAESPHADKKEIILCRQFCLPQQLCVHIRAIYPFVTKLRTLSSEEIISNSCSCSARCFACRNVAKEMKDEEVKIWEIVILSHITYEANGNVTGALHQHRSLCSHTFFSLASVSCVTFVATNEWSCCKFKCNF